MSPRAQLVRLRHGSIGRKKADSSARKIGSLVAGLIFYLIFAILMFIHGEPKRSSPTVSC